MSTVSTTGNVDAAPGEVQTFSAADGTRLAYRLLGTGPLLVCVPGGPGRAAAYLEDLGGLAATRTLLLLDARGTGASAQPTDDVTYSPAHFAADIEALREHLGLDVLDLLGHSAGGRVAQVWASQHPERVGRLVVVCSYLSTTAEQDVSRREVMELRAGEPWYPEAREAADNLLVAPRGERIRMERMLRPFWYGRWDERTQAHAASAEGQTNPRVALRFRGAPVDVEALRAGLAHVDAPVLLVAGDLDGLTPPVCTDELAAALPHAEVVSLPGAGHFPWVDDGPAFAAAVEGFLARTA